MLTAEPSVQLHRLDPGFLATLKDFAARCAAHRYAIKIHVTNGFRDGDKNSHGFGRGIDLRGWIPPSWGADTPANRLKLSVFLAAMWVDTLRDHGYQPGEWGIGAYPPPDDLHFHLDTRPHVQPELYAAVWVGRG